MNKFVSAFTYMILKLAIKYVENDNADFISKSDLEKIKKFNEKNDFGVAKATLFPFLITIANGKKDVLLAFFEKRFAPIYEFGVVQQDVLNYLRTPMENNEPIKYSAIQAKINILFVRNLDGNNIPLFIGDNINELFFSDVTSDILAGISHSVNFVHGLRLERFANLSLASLSVWSKRTTVYNEYKKFKESNQSHNNPEEIKRFKEQFQRNLSYEVSTHELSPHV